MHWSSLGGRADHTLCPSGPARHSGISGRVIGDFCDDYGVPRQMKAALIKKAKFTGGKLGMLS